MKRFIAGSGEDVLHAKCPFCNSQFFFFTDNNWTCLACNKSGSTADFLAEKNAVSYTTASWQLNQELYLTNPDLYAINKIAAEYYTDSLKRTSVVQGYISERGLDEKTTEKFSLGWSDGGLASFLKNYDFSLVTAHKAGLVRDNGKDVFYHRLMFPIKNHLGQIVAFGGRKIDDSYGPKYLNTPETNVFKKSEHLYGIENINPSQPVVLVEGYMDVIAMQKNGFNAVAALGTAVGPHHGQLLRSLGVNNLIVSLDGDSPGITNAVKAVKALTPYIENIFVRNGYADCKDPDEYLKKYTAEEFKSLPLTDVKKFLIQNGCNPVDVL